MTLFRGFDKDFVNLLDLFFVENNYPQGTHLVEQNTLQDRFYLIVAGSVEVYHTIEKGRVPLSNLDAGQFFGEMNLFDPGLATASVIAITPVKTLEISNQQFRFFIESKPESAADFTFQLAETIVRRFRNSNSALMEVLSRPEAIQKAENISRGLPA